MSKKHFYILCTLLIVILLLLIMLLAKTYALETALTNGVNYLSEKLDALTSYVKMME